MVKKKFKVFESNTKVTLIFVFGTRCKHCIKNIIPWHKLFNNLDREKINIFAVTPDSLHLVRKYREMHNLQYPVCVPENLKVFLKDYKLDLVPQTILVGNDSTVINNWTGFLTTESTGDIIKTISKNSYN